MNKVLDYVGSTSVDRLMKLVEEMHLAKDDIQDIVCNGNYILLFYWRDKETNE